MTGLHSPGWPVVLFDRASGVLLRPYKRSDAGAWSRSRIVNRQWLAPWEPTSPMGTWEQLNSPAAFRVILRELRRAGRQGTSMPFAVCLRPDDGPERLVGQVTLGNIVRRAFCSAYAGYWVDSRVAGRGVMPTALALAVDRPERGRGVEL